MGRAHPTVLKWLSNKLVAAILFNNIRSFVPFLRFLFRGLIESISFFFVESFADLCESWSSFLNLDLYLYFVFFLLVLVFFFVISIALVSCLFALTKLFSISFLHLLLGFSLCKVSPYVPDAKADAAIEQRSDEDSEERGHD